MGMIEVASGRSIWRGMDYYNDKKVISWESCGNYTYEGIVSGSENKTYKVHIDVRHPKKSTCNCPFADGRRVVCKHMIALYFTAVPYAVEDFQEKLRRWKEEEELQEEAEREELLKYVKSLSKKELQEQLYEILLQQRESENYY